MATVEEHLQKAEAALADGRTRPVDAFAHIAIALVRILERELAADRDR